MIKVICNASPIIGLTGIGKLNLLWELFDEVVISEAVMREICAGDYRQNISAVKNAIDNGNIKIVRIESADVVASLHGKLHQGELETIIGAKENPTIRFAVIDEKAARNFASTMLVDTLGILGVLSLAKKRGFIEAVRPYVDKLMKNGYRISQALYRQLLAREKEL